MSVKLAVDVDLKMLRETLCTVQTMVVMEPYRSREAKAQHSGYLQSLIDAIDVHRPLGPDGKHGNRHTETCGCEDKPHPWSGTPNGLQQLAVGLREVFPGNKMSITADVLTLTLGDSIVMADDWNTKVDALERVVQGCSGEEIYVSVESCIDLGRTGRVFVFRQHQRV